MKLVKVDDAVGRKLAFDYSAVTPDFKSPIKRRGEVVSLEDVELLKNHGHYYVYIEDGDSVEYGLHEEEAVLQLAQLISGENIIVEKAPEGKALLRSAVNGLLMVDSTLLEKINSTGVYVVITRRKGVYVKHSDIVGIVDLIPLSIPRDYLSYISSEILASRKILQVYRNTHPKIGIIVTGTEIVEGRKKDLASPVVVEKIRLYELEQGALVYVRDDESEIAGAIENLLLDHDAVVVTGGMSIDPTDKTPKAIASVASEVVAYGVPMKPTTMSMIAYKDGKAVIGVSSGIIYFPDYNILDVVLPWIAAGVKIPREYLISFGEGGLSEYFLRRR
ncbi:molybdopterin-binding protein [Desulfurococcus amylolyticus]|uniref:molybdopterin-binding protein n=1 Tax=Desulfurococcus amylolyticus TaxID=94694 RepID=UPI0023F0205A|nr:molybdopterin-binding protein [Desulfurococcus amylolyticus]